MNLWKEVFETKELVADNPFNKFDGFYRGTNNNEIIAFIKSLTGIFKKHFQMIETYPLSEKEDCLSDIFLLLVEKKESIRKLHQSFAELDELDRQYVFSKYLSNIIRNYIIDSRLRKKKIDVVYCEDDDAELSALEEIACGKTEQDVFQQIERKRIFKVYETNRKQYNEYYARAKTKKWAEENGLDIAFFL